MPPILDSPPFKSTQHLKNQPKSCNAHKITNRHLKISPINHHIKVTYMKTVSAYYWNGKVNFGDLLTRDLLSSFGYKVQHKKVNENPHLISVGSILGRVPDDYKGIILGSGLMRPKRVNLSQANIMALRGHLTAQCLRVNTDGIVIGDPGLISDLLVTNTQKKYLLGIIPHFEDGDNEYAREQISLFMKKYEKDVLLINPMDEPQNVLTMISSCHNILSSSLHGIICADSLEIPRARIYISSQGVGGGNFKHEDYHSSLRMQHKIYNFNSNLSMSEIFNMLNTPNKDILNEIKFKLTTAFRRLEYELPNV